MPKWFKNDDGLDIVDYGMVTVLVMYVVTLTFLHWMAGVMTLNAFAFAFMLGRKWQRISSDKPKTGV